MNSDLKKLIRLQEVDIAVADYQARAEAFPAKSRALDEQLASALEGVRKAKAEIDASQVQRKEHEAKVADLETRISKYRDQLMSVKTNDEYKAMNKEIEFSQKAIRAEEDRILANMERAELLVEQLKAAEAILESDRTTVRDDRARLEELNAKDTRTLEAYVEERNSLAAQVGEDVLDRYERVRKAREGVALARALDEACIVCNVRMRPQRFQEVRRNDSIIQCDSCGRILYDPSNMDHPFEVV